MGRCSCRWRVGVIVVEHTRYFEALASGNVRTRSVLESWPELQASRCQHHFVFSIRRAIHPLAILGVFHENMDLPARVRERLDDDGLGA